MFYGLNKFIKNILPKRLFYRALLIVAVPVIVIQLIITIVFFDSLWIKTNKGMTRALIGEIKFFIEAYDNEQYNKDSLTKLFSDTQNIKAFYVPHKVLPKDDLERWFSPMDRTLRRELKSKFSQYWFDTTSFKETIDLKIKYLNGYFQFEVPKSRVTNSSARTFALWITLPAFLLITISLIFLKNQTRPITNLAKAAEKFGRGEEIEEGLISDSFLLAFDIYATTVLAFVGISLNILGCYQILSRPERKKMFNLMLAPILVFDTIYVAFKLMRSLEPYIPSPVEDL